VGWGGGCRVEHAFACGWGWVLVPGNQGSPAAPPGEPAGGGVWPRDGRLSGERVAVGFHELLDPPLDVGDGQVVQSSGGAGVEGGLALRMARARQVALIDRTSRTNTDRSVLACHDGSPVHPVSRAQRGWGTGDSDHVMNPLSTGNLSRVGVHRR
jgi:hypothetical protein